MARRLISLLRSRSGFTGRADLIALIQQGRWRQDEDVILLHVGGAPALFACQSVLGICAAPKAIT